MQRVRRALSSLLIFAFVLPWQPGLAQSVSRPNIGLSTPAQKPIHAPLISSLRPKAVTVVPRIPTRGITLHPRMRELRPTLPRNAPLDPLAMHRGHAAVGLPAIGLPVTRLGPAMGTPIAMMRAGIHVSTVALATAVRKAKAVAPLCPAVVVFKGRTLPPIPPTCACPPAYRELPNHQRQRVPNTACPIDKFAQANHRLFGSPMLVHQRLFTPSPIVATPRITSYAIGRPASKLAAAKPPGAPMKAAHLSTRASVVRRTLSAPGNAYANAVLADAPMAFYELDDTGTTATDSGPYALNGSIGPSVTTGIAPLILTGHAMSFPGGPESTAVQVRVSESTKLEPSTAVTIEFWVNLAALTGDLVAYGNDSTAESYSASVASTGALCFWLHTTADGGSCLFSNAFLQLGVPAHVVMVYDGAMRSIYINGRLDASAAESGTLAGYDTTNGLAIGGGYALSDPASAAAIDEVSLYPTALPQSRIVAHYQAGIGQIAQVPTVVQCNAGNDYGMTAETVSLVNPPGQNDVVTRLDDRQSGPKRREPHLELAGVFRDRQLHQRPLHDRLQPLGARRRIG
ncbi:MAG: LamG-like jellyroll fold domain-containing protein [Vulcanimicrobiaceae bacterium]